MTKKPGVMIYFETAQSLKALDYEQKGRLFEAIMEYAEHGTVPPLDGILTAVWPFLANSIDRDAKSYAKTVMGRKRAGYAKWWPDFAAENGLDVNDKAAKERWIDQQIANEANASDAMQMDAKDANACFAMQTMPTTTSTPTPTPAPTTTSTPTGTPTRAGTTGAEPASPARAYGLYWNVMLTDDEYAELQAEIPNLQNEVNKLSEYMKRTGKHYDSHAATIRKWAREDAQKQATQARRNSGNVFLDALKGGGLE